MREKGLFHISSQGLSKCCLAIGLPDCTWETAAVHSPGQVEPHRPSWPATLLDKMWSKTLITMKWMQLFLSRSCVNNCSGLQLRAELGAFIHRSVSKKLGSVSILRARCCNCYHTKINHSQAHLAELQLSHALYLCPAWTSVLMKTSPGALAYVS